MVLRIENKQNMTQNIKKAAKLQAQNLKKSSKFRKKWKNKMIYDNGLKNDYIYF
jgi:hypothetical protein